jgi:hypothetical protein
MPVTRASSVPGTPLSQVRAEAPGGACGVVAVAVAGSSVESLEP